MNNRFRFRAWNKEEKEMYYDAQDTYDYMTGNPVIFAESFSCLLTNDEEWEVEQCTGLKDKNGNLIYEGDRIFDGDYFWQVKWDNYNAQWILSDPEGYETLTEPDAKYLEIIGNIHEQKD